MSSQSASGRVGSGPRTAAIDYFSSPIYGLRPKHPPAMHKRALRCVCAIHKVVDLECTLTFRIEFMESHLTIDEVAKRTGLTAYTLRYYERIGLIAAVTRAAGGQRRYSATDMAWLEFLLRLRTTNMPIGKMQAFAKLRDAGDSTVPDRRQMLEEHLTDVQARIEAMQQSAEALHAKIEHYHSLERSLAPCSNSNEGCTDEQGKSLRTRPGKASRN